MALTARIRSFGRRLVASVILLAVAWLVLKFVIGAVTAVAWIVVAILALVATLWAVNVLRR